MALISVSGNLYDASGNPLQSVTVVFTLANYSGNLPLVSGTNILAPIKVNFTTNSSGHFSGNIQGNDSITPAGTVYQVDYPGGVSAAYSFSGAGPIDLDSYRPVNVIPVPAGSVPSNILSGNNTFTGIQTFSGEGAAGNVALKAAASDAVQYISVNGNNSNDGLSPGTAKGGADLGAAVAAAKTAIGSNPGTIYILPGSYNQTTAISCTSDLTISGYGGLVNSSVTGSSLVCANVFRSRVFGLRFIGPSTTGSAIGLQLGVNSGGNGTPTEWNSLRDLWFTNFHYGVDGQGSSGGNGTFYNTLANISSQANNIGFHLVPGTTNFFNDNSFHSVFSAGNTTDAYVLDGANGNQFSNAEGENNGGYGVHFTGVSLTQGNVFVGGWLESNTTADIGTGSVSNVQFNVFCGTTLESGTNFSTLANLQAGHNTIIPGTGGTGATDFVSNSISADSIASATANSAVAGVLRLANGDLINWRNNANSADISLAKNTSDQLTFAGNEVMSELASGFGNGSAGTAVTTTAKGTGTGPTTPQTVVKYVEIDVGGTLYWIPLVQ